MDKVVIHEGYIKVSCPKARRYPEHPGVWKTTAVLSKGKPSVSADEVAVKVRLELPASLFQAPQLEARISVPEANVTPPVLDLTVRENISQLIQEQTGMEITLVPIDGKEIEAE